MRFAFEESWHLPARPEALRDVLVDLERYPTWWPQVVAVARIDDDRGRVLCRSTLPYTLDLVLRAVSRDLPTLEVAVSGHLEGAVAWTLRPEAGGTRMEMRQQVDTRGAVVSLGAALAPGLLRWNHARMMAGCRRGLLARVGVSGGSRAASDPAPRRAPG